MNNIIIPNTVPESKYRLEDVSHVLGGGKRSGGGYSVRCCCHDDSSPSLSVKVGDDGKLLVYCHAGCESVDVLREIDRLLGGGARKLFEFTRTVNDQSDKQRSINRVWKESRGTIEGDLVWTYLVESRKLPLDSIPEDLRFHPDLPYYENSDDKPALIGRYPAMVAAVRDVDGRLVTLHRTYLNHDARKLEGRQAKKLMPSASGVKGCAIRLGTVGDVVVVAEGIETALAASVLSGLPAWCALNAVGVASLVVSESVCKVVVAADRGEVGEKAAEALAGRMLRAGKVVELVVAPEDDWASMLEDSGEGNE